MEGMVGDLHPQVGLGSGLSSMAAVMAVEGTGIITTTWAEMMVQVFGLELWREACLDICSVTGMKGCTLDTRPGTDRGLILKIMGRLRSPTGM